MQQRPAEDVVTFGDLVQLRRNELGLTRSELAQRVSCSPVTIKKIERGERRPSLQIAELLAARLLIPEADRKNFVRMARGELAAWATPGLVSLPAFLKLPSVEERSDDVPFVAREAELAQLDARLDAALQGAGSIVFITGEAGDGKTRLAQDFIRRAQERHLSLVAAQGNCNAYAGIGDPYLPFREILALLAGDIEAQWVAGNLSRRYAERLWNLVPSSIEALLAYGSDLVDIFVPGEELTVRMAGAAPAQVDKLTRLERLVARHRSGAGLAHVEQSSLFAQYARTLQALARERPLLLMIDDLQWADEGSISLLFHLARSLAGHFILVVGLYRPSELSAGRDGGRHPLEPVVNELRRSHGDIHVDLRRTEGRPFVEAFLDVEPNCFDTQFREALYAQTAGHPLFTVEMLRGMQDRGEIVRDDEGRWTAAVELDWGTLPARIEGVIREHLGRLPDPLLRALQISSVEGEVFSAEVAARVQSIDAVTLIHEIGRVLNRQYRMVQSQEQLRLAGSRLTRYRFRHILFQQYLYASLDPGERSSLHLAVGDALEDAYGDQADSIAPQLAMHFDLGADDRRALHYFTVAGDAAAAAHGHAEAGSHYRRAIEIGRRLNSSGGTVSHLYAGLGRALELGSQFEAALGVYEEMRALALERGDRPLELAALSAQVTLFATFTPVNDPAKAEALAEQALDLARELDAAADAAKLHWLMVLVYHQTMRMAQAIESGERSLAIARRLGLREQMAYVLNDLGSHVYLVAGPLDRAISVLEEASIIWRELDNLPMLANSVSAAALVRLYTGAYEEALVHSEEAVRISQSIDNLWGQSYARFSTGHVYWELGEPGRAIEAMEECIQLAERAGFMAAKADTRATLAHVLGSLGADENALDIAQHALSVAEEHVPMFGMNVLAVLAQIYLQQGELDEARSAVERSLEDPLSASWPLQIFRARIAECELILAEEDYEHAITLAGALLDDLEEHGARTYIPYVGTIHGLACLRSGQEERGIARLRQAKEEAEQMGSLPGLWPALYALSEVEIDPQKASALRRQAREIVATIAKRCPTPELSASFLSQPRVQAVLGVQA